MSYKRSFSKRISINYSGSKTVSVPEGYRSVTVNYSGTAYEDVYVNINVDTNSFDSGVASCNQSVNLLTGAVVATETAQLVSIDKNAKKIGATIVEGFFKTIRTEIGQQIMELSQKIDSNIVHLRELAKACISKQKQMETDYNRISHRYLKIFDDLNNELENRIFELNKPAFVFKRDSDSHALRTTGGDLVSTVTVFGREGSELQARLSASITKKRAFDAVNQANTYLKKQKVLEDTISASMLKESSESSIFTPVCFVETQNGKTEVCKNVYQPNFLSQTRTVEIMEDLTNRTWSAIEKEQIENVRRYFDVEVNKSFVSNNPHDNRVKEMIVEIFDLKSTKSI